MDEIFTGAEGLKNIWNNGRCDIQILSVAATEETSKKISSQNLSRYKND